MDYKKLLLLLCFASAGHGKIMSQITGSFSFGGIVSEASNLTSFSGPVLISGDKNCLDVVNGVIVFGTNNKATGVFDISCQTAVKVSGITYQAYPNPATPDTRVFVRGFIDPNTKFNLKILDSKGQLIYTTNGVLSQLQYGMNLSFAHFSSGIYLVTIVTKNNTSTLKLIKTGN